MENWARELTPTPQPRKIYSVSQVNRIAKETLENFSGWVQGEVSGLQKIKTKFDTFFLKFNLKDEVTLYILPVVAFSQVFETVDFELENGLAIVIFGNLSLFENRGEYQLNAQVIELFGEGLLQKQRELRKRKLASEGLFAQEKKKPIPEYPERIGLITRFERDAWFDFKKNAIDKFLFLQLYYTDVFVQGKNAVSDIVEALKLLNEKDLDVIVLTRGGGSQEDLAAFDSDEVVRAIAASKIPIISAIGHEKYETFADLAADAVVSTPTAAAKLVTAKFEEFLAKAEHLEATIRLLAAKFYQTKLLEISLLEKEFEGDVKNFLTQKSQVLDNLENNLRVLPITILTENKRKLEILQRELELLSPQRILERGYSVTYKLKDGAILKNAKDVSLEDKIRVRLARGDLKAKVFEIQ